MEEQPDTYGPMAGSSLGDPWVAEFLKEPDKQVTHVSGYREPHKGHIYSNPVPSLLFMFGVQAPVHHVSSRCQSGSSGSHWA